MILGLKRGAVELADHDPEWEKLASDTVKRLWRVFGSAAKDIQHVGSTAIRHIKAKPIIDIAVAVDDFNEVEFLTPALEAEGFIRRDWFPNENEQMLYAVGYDVEPNDRVTTHFIHIVRYGSAEFHDYINFRDYLNANPYIAKEYENIKTRLALENPYDPGREKYLAGKHDFVASKIHEARIWAEFGKVFTKIEPIIKGWSNDKKYYIETADGKRFLLRVSDIKEYDRKKAEYEIMERVYDLGVHTSQPIKIGLCNNKKSTYTLTGWIDGEDVGKKMQFLTETEQYVLGLKAGGQLHRIHSVSAPEEISGWAERYFAVIDERVAAYRSQGIPFEGSETVLEYFEKHRGLLLGRPQNLIHGDYHEGNLMAGTDGDLYVIDWLDEGFGNYGDPWYDFKTFGENDNAFFATGFVRGYFGGEPPREFWDILTYYIATSALTAIVWMKYNKPEELPETLKWNEKNARFIRMGCSPLMKLYLKEFYIQWIDCVPYKLKAPFAFSFLNKYGNVFKVFDEQGSGNISFGIKNGDSRYFIKFAGAPMPNYIANRHSGEVDAANAIEFLRAAVPIYTELAHPNLIRFISAEEIGDGYAAVFEWEDAIGIEPRNSPACMKFIQMPMDKKLRAFEDIMYFHAHAAKKGYVALDFYDGSILYDYAKEKVIICDIDLYQKSPFINADGLGIVGSARYVSPEECAKDAVMDEITNVYTMGATAFSLFAYGDRSPEAWPLSPKLYSVVKKAVNDDRSERQQSIEQLIAEWKTAK